MRFRFNFALAALLLPALLAATAGAGELADKGRDIFNKNRLAVVTVMVVVKTSDSSGRSRESKQEITGTVVDPSGLTVLALSSCDPTEMYRRLYEGSRYEFEVSDLKILLEDGTELPSEIVLRDKDLDLAYIRPKAKPAAPLAAVDLSKSGQAQVLDDVVAINRLNKAASRAYSVSVEHVAAVVQKPRTFYVPDSTMTPTASGAPAFTVDGKILGLFVMRVISGAGDGGDSRQNVTSIIIPAEDVLKGAKQAPEAKGDGEKKDEKKNDAKESTEKKDATEKK